MSMFSSVPPPEWKAQITRRKDPTDQGEMAFLAPVLPMGEADQQFIGKCSWEGAIRYAVQRSGKDDFEVADDIGISHGYMSKVLKGTAGLYGKRLVKFMYQTQCIAPLQWIADQLGYQVVPKSAQAEIQKMRALMAALQQSAA